MLKYKQKISYKKQYKKRNFQLKYHFIYKPLNNKYITNYFFKKTLFKIKRLIKFHIVIKLKFNNYAISKKTFNSRMGKGTGKIIGFKFRNQLNRLSYIIFNKNYIRLCLKLY